MAMEWQTTEEQAEMMNLKAAFNTMKASSFQIWMAQIFGRKRIFCDPQGKTKLAYWRGKYYLINFEPKEKVI